MTTICKHRWIEFTRREPGGKRVYGYRCVLCGFEQQGLVRRVM